MVKVLVACMAAVLGEEASGGPWRGDWMGPGLWLRLMLAGGSSWSEGKDKSVLHIGRHLKVHGGQSLPKHLIYWWDSAQGGTELFATCVPFTALDLGLQMGG